MRAGSAGTSLPAAPGSSPQSRVHLGDQTLEAPPCGTLASTGSPPRGRSGADRYANQGWSGAARLWVQIHKLRMSPRPRARNRKWGRSVRPRPEDRELSPSRSSGLPESRSPRRRPWSRCLGRSAGGARAPGTAAAGAVAATEAAHAVAFRAQESVEPAPRRSGAAGAEEPWQPVPPQECGIPWGQGLKPTLRQERGSHLCCGQSAGGKAARVVLSWTLGRRRRHPQHPGAKASIAAFRVREPAPAPPPPGTGAQPWPEHQSTGTTAARVQSRDDGTLARRLPPQAWRWWLPQLRRARGRTARSPADSCLLLQGQRPCGRLECLEEGGRCWDPLGSVQAPWVGGEGGGGQWLL